MNKIIGRNLKIFRDYNHFTQETVTTFLGLNNRSTYSNYETGDREAPLEVLEQCANLYGCELSAFFMEDENAVNEMLICAFRVDSISMDDMHEIAKFKNIVKQYLKLNALITR